MDDVVQMAGALDPRSGWSATHCSVAKALDVVSTRTAFLLLREAFYGTTRFDDFAERIGASEPVTSARLRELVDAGLLVKEPYKEPGQRTRQRYVLTEMGTDLFPTVVALMQWGDRWTNDGGYVHLEHTGCGGRIHAELRCEHGHPVTPGETELHRNRAA
ncbi:helix-turn-helix transcriptional regulator [Solirubrobacter phytolaccae]|uniref:Helix-turn-helix transcriptional regulator n=1 Tax=Solirubrobacter phytolaccae TaxID=1404360 RepID=A0A9X3NH21_9ACTN|nr:helix-turn-helix domain-containing protein [Solirubrobacter phytolaccae]MDA0181092.1 helix-turn-helix transcriptional regulator [Solirubrobacter phytolaccae]